MKNYILKLGILALGTAGLLLLAPKKKEVVETVKSKIKDMKSQVKFEPEKEKISLSLRQAQPDPWQDVEQKCRTGSIMEGQVTKLAKKFVFVELYPGVEGVIPLNELAEKKVVKPQEIVKEGQKIRVKLLNVRADQRRIVLSLKQALSEAEEAEYKQYMGKGERTFTLGALLKSRGETLPGAEKVLENETPASTEKATEKTGKAEAKEVILQATLPPELEIRKGVIRKMYPSIKPTEQQQLEITVAAKTKGEITLQDIQVTYQDPLGEKNTAKPNPTKITAT